MKRIVFLLLLAILPVFCNAENRDSAFNQDIAQPLTASKVMLPVGITHSTMQGLDIDKKGNFYISWEEKDGVHIRAFRKNGKARGEEMFLPNGGHGDGFSMEFCSKEPYFWTSGTLGDHMKNGGYAGGRAIAKDIRLICRYKFQPGKTQYAEDAVECYYLNDNGCRMIDVDQEHDIMACWTYKDGSDYFYIYKFSEIKKAGKTSKFVSRSSHNNNAEVSVYDLNTITPISAFPWKRKGVTTGTTNTGAVQGICIYDDRIYILSGGKGDSAALMSILDINGNIVKALIPVGVSADKQKLIDLKLSSDGSFEPEGVHIHEGRMYLGFVGDFPEAGSNKHACILRLE